MLVKTLVEIHASKFIKIQIVDAKSNRTQTLMVTCDLIQAC